MAGVLRRDGIYLPRFWWWWPWHLSRPWIPAIWKGGDEWCNVPLCFTVPPFGSFLFFQFWRPLRTMPCDEEWALMDETMRADYLPGGYLEGGRAHPERTPAWESA